MRILLCVHQFLPDFFAGTEILTYDSAQALRARGHKVQIFTGYAGLNGKAQASFHDEYEYDGIKVNRYFYDRNDPLLCYNTIESSYNNPRSAILFENTLNQFKPDIVHFYHLERLSASALSVCHRRKVPTIFTATDYWLLCPTHQLFLPDNTVCSGPDDVSANCLKHLCMVSRSNALRHFANLMPLALIRIGMRILAKLKLPIKQAAMLRSLMNRQNYLRKKFQNVGKVMVATQHMQNLLKRWGIPESKIVQMPFAVKATIQEVRKTQKRNTGELVVGFVGTLLTYKGVHILIKALKRIQVDLPIIIEIYGDLAQFPSYGHYLKEIAGDDPRVKFMGTFSPDKINSVIRRFDVLVVPSLWPENTPLVIHHAINNQVPVIGSDVSGISEVILDRTNGYLFREGDTCQLERILERLCVERSEIDEMSKKMIPLNTMDNYISKLERIYRDIGTVTRLPIN